MVVEVLQCQCCLALAASNVVTIIIVIVKLQPYYLVLLLLSITPTGTICWTGYGCLLMTMLPSAG